MTSLKSRFRPLSCRFMRTPLHKPTLSLELCWVLQTLPKFTERVLGLDFPFCTAWPLPYALPTFFSHSWQFIDILCLSDQQNKFVSFCARSLALVLHSPILVFLAFAKLCWDCPHFWPHVIGSCCRLNFCQSPPEPHVSLRRSFLREENCQTSPWIWQTSVLINVNAFHLHELQIGVSGHCYVDMYQWNRECFFLGHVEMKAK